MATYSTNLGLTLIGTGEQSGTWGTTTNTNLGTLLEQAISGYVTQAVSAGTTTLTIPDGATGVARNMFIELTGTGGGSLVVPAKRKLYFIYNNSSAVITVKVSSGVDVPAGAKMVLVCNGTDIVNAVSYFASLSLGTITTTSDSLINGLTIGKGGTSVATNTALGNNALAANTTGSQNLASGTNALLANTTGGFNVALGSGALQTNIGGSYNSAVGANALASNTTGTQNTGVGSGALYYVTSTQNTGVGSGALYGVTTGANNSGFGFQAGYGVTTGSSNVIIGSYAGAVAPISATGSNYVVLSDGAANVRAYWNGADATFNGALGLAGSFSRGAPVVKTADFTLASTENWVQNNKSAAPCVVTLPAASAYVGREVMFKNIQAQTLVSVASDVVPLAGGSAGTAILDASAGAWAVLVSNGTTWTISEASAVPVAVVGAIKVWGVFDGTVASPTCSASGNVASITKNGTGDYTVTFTNALSSANYSASVIAQPPAGNNQIQVLPFWGPSATAAAPTTTTFRFMVIVPGTGFVDSARITFSVVA